jgi:hypothetical protein
VYTFSGSVTCANANPENVVPKSRPTTTLGFEGAGIAKQGIGRTRSVADDNAIQDPSVLLTYNIDGENDQGRFKNRHSTIDQHPNPANNDVGVKIHLSTDATSKFAVHTDCILKFQSVQRRQADTEHMISSDDDD